MDILLFEYINNYTFSLFLVVQISVEVYELRTVLALYNGFTRLPFHFILWRVTGL